MTYHVIWYCQNRCYFARIQKKRQTDSHNFIDFSFNLQNANNLNIKIFYITELKIIITQGQIRNANF